MKTNKRHKHIYQKIILHYGGSTFVWGGECEICGRIDDRYKASDWKSEELKVKGNGTGGTWEDICRRELKEKYPECKIMIIENKKWTEWEDNY